MQTVVGFFGSVLFSSIVEDRKITPYAGNYQMALPLLPLVFFINQLVLYH